MKKSKIVVFKKKEVIEMSMPTKVKSANTKKVVKVKPILATTIIAESKYISEIKESITTKPTMESFKRNKRALELLKKARRG